MLGINGTNFEISEERNESTRERILITSTLLVNPVERKRRASSLQYAKHSKAAAAAAAADAQGQGMAESPTSMTSAATLSTVSTPGGVQAAGGDNMPPSFSNMNVYLGPNDLQDDQFHFDTNAFDLMVQQVRNGQNQELIM